MKPDNSMSLEDFKRNHTDQGKLAAAMEKKKRKLTLSEKEQKLRIKLAKKKAKEIFDRMFTKACVNAGLPAPFVEFKLHPVRNWKCDYFFQRGDIKVALEVEGGIYTNGRHTRGKGFYDDMEKYNALSMQGILLLRTQPKELMPDTITPDMKILAIPALLKIFNQ